jgi:Glutamate-1-semialdehyde aminotransferase
MEQQYSISEWPDADEIEEKMSRLMNDRIYHIRPEAMRRYMNYFDEKCMISKAMTDEAKKYIPGGVQHNLAFNYPFPLAVRSADGPYLFDEDGNRYVDYLQAGGPTILGSNYIPVQEKAIEVIRSCSPCTGLFNEYEMKLAKTVNKYMPWVEMFRSVASGTEADMVAIRAARAYTGNKKIIKVGSAYHGWSDQLVYSLHIPETKRFEACGIPEECTANTQEVRNDDIEDLRRLLEANRQNGGTAGVLLEPVGPESGTRLVHHDYNKKVRALCDEYGALLIFDEVVTGFRIGMGGAQGYFGVRPDITVFGKIVAGGYPAAGGIGGRREIMECLSAGVALGKPRAYIGGTLSANPLSCAAGHFAIEEIAETGAVVKAGINGDKLREGIQALVNEYHLPFVVWNIGSIVHFEVAGMMYISADNPKLAEELTERKDAVAEFGAALTANGVITLAGSRIYTSMADNDETLKATLKAFEDVLSNIEK